MTNWLIRKTGADTNGGTSATVRSTGTDGIASAAGGTTKFTSISATWTSADIGHGIYASSGTILRLISAVQVQQTATGTTNGSTTHVTSSAAFNATMLGCAVSGPGIAAGTIVVAYNNSSDISLSIQPSGGVGTGTITFGPLLTTTGTTAFTAATGQTWNVGGALLTFARAMVTASGVHNAYSAGDSIYVGAGTYRETVANTLSGSQLSTTYNGSNGSSLTTLGSVITLTSVTGLVAPPAGYYNQGSVVTSAGVVGFTWTGISGSTLTGVTFLTNNAVTSAATVASSATLLVSTPIWVIGDVDGAQTGQAGQVSWSGFTTNDTSAPSATVLLALAATTNIFFALMTFIGGNANVITSTTPTAVSNYGFIDCTINALTGVTAAVVSFTSSTTGVALGITFDRCIILASRSLTFPLATTATGAADWDSLVNVRNSLVIVCSTAQLAIAVTATGTAANKGGGVRCFNVTILGGSGGFATSTASQLSTTVPCEIHNSNILEGSGSTGISAATAGQIVGDHNNISAQTPETNYTYGTGDKSNSAGTGTYAAPLLELGQSFKWAGVTRPFMAPDGMKSPLLGFGASANSPQTVDWFNRPRPSGGGSSSNGIGYAEFHDFSVQDTVTYPTGQTSSAKMTGPGDTDIWVPVDATSTTIAIQLYQGAGYTGTTYATATLEAQGELGVAGQVETCTSATGSWQTLTFSAISPTKAGYVKVRVTSFDTSGTGTLNFGALTAT